MTNVFFSQAILSLLPGSVGSILGFGLGSLIAWWLLRVLSPAGLMALSLLPWRTAVMALEVAVLGSPIIIPLAGVGWGAGMVTVGLSLFLLALPYAGSMVISRSYPSPFSVKLISGLRTLLVASIAIALFAGFQTGAGGAGGWIWSGTREGQPPLLLEGFLVVIILALIVDLTIGAAQWIVSSRQRSVPMNDSSKPQAAS